MRVHDPKNFLALLRDHLTQSDTNVAFLFGAGTSCAVQIPVALELKEVPADGDAGDNAASIDATRSLIPNVAALTAICAKEIRKLDTDEKKFSNALDLMLAEVATDGRIPNIEDILSCVRRKQQAIGVNDKLAGLLQPELETFEQVIRRTIASQVNPDVTNFPSRLPHEDLVRWVARMPRAAPVELFTTNYDILFETALEAERVPSFDGFVGCNRPFFCHEALSRPESSPGSAWTRLWKLHGSINWAVDIVRGRRRIVRVGPSNEGEMIMPSHHKYDESRKQPYTALMERLTRVLARDDTVLITCGYSFSDEHINAILFDGLDARPRPHIIALQYADPEEGHVLWDRAAKSLNLMVIGDRQACIGGRRGNWAIETSRIEGFLSSFFTQDIAEDDPEKLLATGTFRLGDFNRFAEFLSSITKQA